MAVVRQHDDDDPDGTDGVIYQELSPDEGRSLFDRCAHERLGMSGEEFVRCWEAGEIEDPDRTPVVMLALMIPFARAG